MLKELASKEVADAESACEEGELQEKLNGQGLLAVEPAGQKLPAVHTAQEFTVVPLAPL